MLKHIVAVVAFMLFGCGAPVEPGTVDPTNPLLYRAPPACLQESLEGKSKQEIMSCGGEPCRVEESTPSQGWTTWVYCSTESCSSDCWWSTRVVFEGDVVSYTRRRSP
jgi:hypothetical protein